MKLSAKSHDALVAIVQEALGHYLHDGDTSVVTDIHFQPRQDSGELVIYNDDDEELARTLIDEWVDYADDDFYAKVEHLLRATLNDMKETGAFANVKIMTPYSFVLVDDEKETVTELLLMDDEDTLLLNEELLKGLDEELDAFLKDLLEK